MRFTPKDREDWRRWLQDNHATEQEVWLVFFKKASNRYNLSYGVAVEEALCFGWIDGLKRSLDAQRYVHRFTPRKPHSKWSKANKDRARSLIRSGRMTPAGRSAIESAKKSGTWAHPVSPPGGKAVRMPPELRDRLNRNPQAAEFFAGLAPSYRRQFLAWIEAAKKPETRRRRLDETMDLLSRRQKLGMR